MMGQQLVWAGCRQLTCVIYQHCLDCTSQFRSHIVMFTQNPTPKLKVTHLCHLSALL
jgi:hypothetical protein